MTVKMRRIDDGYPADVHPDEVENWKSGGWEVVEDVPALVSEPEEERKQDDEEDEGDLHAAKGPRGRWFVKRGKKIVSEAFDTEDEALSELRKMTVVE